MTNKQIHELFRLYDSVCDSYDTVNQTPLSDWNFFGCSEMLDRLEAKMEVMREVFRILEVHR